MLDDGYLDPNTQKAFLPIPGCIEHQSKLGSVISSAKKSHRSVAIAWLDLANAYGSVHHDLIQFSLRHYHLPHDLCNLIRLPYTNLSVTIITKQWSTTHIQLKKGVYQGDPLSVIIFNLVINTLVDTLKQDLHHGFTLPKSRHQINLLQFADYTCLIGKDSAAITPQWLQWSGMKAKVPKCHSVPINSSSGKPFDPHLNLDQQEIPFIDNKTIIMFLGLPILVYIGIVEVKRKIDRYM